MCKRPCNRPGTDARAHSSPTQSQCSRVSARMHKGAYALVQMLRSAHAPYQRWIATFSTDPDFRRFFRCMNIRWSRRVRILVRVKVAIENWIFIFHYKEYRRCLLIKNKWIILVRELENFHLVFHFLRRFFQRDWNIHLDVGLRSNFQKLFSCHWTLSMDIVVKMSLSIFRF